MKNKNLIYTIGFVCFMIAMLISSVEIVAFSNSFYKKQYHKLNTAHTLSMTEDDLFLATDLLLDYIKDERNNLDLEVSVNQEKVEMFNKREKDHMIDVKNLFLNFHLFKNILFGIAFIIFIMAIKNKDIYNFMLVFKVIKQSMYSIFSVISLIILYALIDFNSFWTSFHKVLFSNDLWILDPQTDRMINMFPESFFNQMVLRIIILFLSIQVLLGLSYTLFYKIQTRKEVK